jgi:hypothetical protein
MQKEGISNFDSSSQSFIFDVNQIQENLMVAYLLADILHAMFRLRPRFEQKART